MHLSHPDILPGKEVDASILWTFFLQCLAMVVVAHRSWAHLELRHAVVASDVSDPIAVEAAKIFASELERRGASPYTQHFAVF